MDVRGLALFRDWFGDHQDKYVLIGGCAAHTTLGEAGLEARATKDLDIVLVVEALDTGFAQRFWAFIEAGGYEIRQKSAEQTPTFYRFDRPSDQAFPKLIELFGRAPDLSFPLVQGSHLTPIPIDQDVSSLSAILLDEHYYAFILAGRREQRGLQYIGEDRLIPLKAVAWLELRERQRQGHQIDTTTIRKHIVDVLSLARLLQPGRQIKLPPRIGDDLLRFVTEAATEQVDIGHLPGRQTPTILLARIATAFGLADADTDA